jgi:hypothetical protein
MDNRYRTRKYNLFVLNPNNGSEQHRYGVALLYKTGGAVQWVQYPKWSNVVNCTSNCYDTDPTTQVNYTYDAAGNLSTADSAETDAFNTFRVNSTAYDTQGRMLNRPGYPGGSLPWKRGWSHGYTRCIREVDGASVHGGAEGPGGPSGVGVAGGDGSASRVGEAGR